VDLAFHYGVGLAWREARPSSWDEDTMTKRLSFVSLALLGAAVGATAALLTVPAAGEQTRRRLTRWLGAEAGRVARMGHNPLDFERIYYNEGADDFADVVNL
jgi:hypothetical protein